MNGTMIPDAVHICPGCDVLCEGERFCERCRSYVQSSQFHAQRAAECFGGLPREDGRMPDARHIARFERWLWGSIYAAGAVIGVAVVVDIFRLF